MDYSFKDQPIKEYIFGRYARSLVRMYKGKTRIERVRILWYKREYSRYARLHLNTKPPILAICRALMNRPDTFTFNYSEGWRADCVIVSDTKTGEEFIFRLDGYKMGRELESMNVQTYPRPQDLVPNLDWANTTEKLLLNYFLSRWYANYKLAEQKREEAKVKAEAEQERSRLKNLYKND